MSDFVRADGSYPNEPSSSWPGRFWRDLCQLTPDRARALVGGLDVENKTFLILGAPDQMEYDTWNVDGRDRNALPKGAVAIAQFDGTYWLIQLLTSGTGLP